MSRLSRRLPIILFLLLLILPTLELAVIFFVGNRIGVWPTLTLLIVESLFGAWIVKREGRRSWNALKTVLSSHSMPSRELADAALVLVGGTLLLTPGFVTDAVGFFCVIPITRPIARRVLTRMVENRLLGSVTVVSPGGSPFSNTSAGAETSGAGSPGTGFGSTFPGASFPGTSGPNNPRTTSNPDVIPGEIIDPPETTTK